MSHDEIRDDGTDVTPSHHHSSDHVESAHSRMNDIIVTGAEATQTSPSPKQRSSQSRRNKLIAAFQRAKKGTGEEEEESQEVADSDAVTKPDTSKEDVRSVRFLSPSERGNAALSGDEAQSSRCGPTKTPQDGETTKKANESTLGASQRRSLFQYIGTSQQKTSDDEHKTEP